MRLQHQALTGELSALRKHLATAESERDTARAEARAAGAEFADQVAMNRELMGRKEEVEWQLVR